MIHLFAGGKSSLDYTDKDLEGLKVGINFAYEATENIDLLIYVDDVVGYGIQKTYKVRPLFEIVCARRNGHMIKNWVYEEAEVTYGSFTISFALTWLREKFPFEEIYVYGLDGGDAKDYYDEVILDKYGYKQPEALERIKRLNRCYKELENLPCGTDKIYNMNPNSPCKAFEFAKP